ncbi:MAG: hypothetical protein IPM51_07230 [Sphingobacteriaceae bacterium]|nr:hypothetical protein [Sphingobacteriaceae bacterium]
MIDFTTIQANPIPPPIIELQAANSALQGKNKALNAILIVGGVLLGMFIADKVITYIKEENERKNKNKFPRVQASSRE